MKKWKIAVAGLMGAGKSIFTGFLAAALRDEFCEVRIIDADAEAKKLMHGNTALQQALIDSFGNDVVNNGNVVSSVLAGHVFSAPSRLLTLNAIVHPLLLERLRELVFTAESDVIICDAALISLWQIEEWFDKLFWVTASFGKRCERLLQKWSLTADTLKNRMEIQQEIIALPQGDRWNIIENNGDMETLQTRALAFGKNLQRETDEI
jgi:dephospho-CoA kinase